MVKFDDLTKEQQEAVEAMGYVGLFATPEDPSVAYKQAENIINTLQGGDKIGAYTALHCLVNSLCMASITNCKTLDIPRQLWYFSFGHGQKHFGRYVKIFGTYGEARQEMFKRYDDEFCMQYDSIDDIGIDRWKLEELKWTS